MASIELQRVSKRYPDGTEAIKEMSLSVADGEIMILVGPSGCGKSTALRMIAGLEPITDGDLLLDGERVNDLAPRDRDIAMVFQSYALYPHMTVRKNMGFALKLAKCDRDEIHRKVERAAELLDLSEHLDRKPARLSGGQRQRVAMGRAIVRDPQAFLMDEPLSNLDAKLRVEMRMSIARLQRRLGTTTVYVTHDQTEAMTLGDRVAVMRRGVVQQVDTPAVLYDDPANMFVAAFLGSPSINLTPGRIEGSSMQLPFGSAPLPRNSNGDMLTLGRNGANRDVIVGFRPDHLDVATVDRPREGQLCFRARIEMVESTGSAVYAYFATPTPAGTVPLTPPDGGESGELLNVGPGSQTIAQLRPGSPAAVGEEVEFALDLSRIKLFEPHTGARLW